MINLLRRNIAHRRANPDSGDASLVTFVIVMPLFFFFLVTIIDVSIFFSNRTIIAQQAQNAARTAAIFGGAGGSINGVVSESPLEYSFGSGQGSFNSVCPASEAQDHTPIECELLASLGNTDANPNGSIPNLNVTNPGLTNTDVSSVSCTPAIASYIGETITCQVEWKYFGIPGSFFSFLNSARSGQSLDNTLETTVGTAQSEVNLTGVSTDPVSTASNSSP